MKIAVIGGGVSGLVSAYLLATHHQVTIYEKNDRLGGHAHTVFVGSDKIPVDNGFMVYNPSRYPNFCALLDDLGVETMSTDMSFGVTIPGAISYSGKFPRGIFLDRANMLSLRYIRFLLQIVRFKKLAYRELKLRPNSSESLGQFLSRKLFGKDVIDWFLVPMLAAIWSIKDTQNIADFPAISTFAFMNNHRLLNLVRPKWRTIKGGSTRYVEKIKSHLLKHNVDIRLGQTIQSITRSKDKVTIVSSGLSLEYDCVVMATHADTAAKLLGDVNADEAAALSCFAYTDNTTILHRDSSQAPHDSRLLSAWNYRKEKTHAVFTYCMNILQHIPFETPMFVTLNPMRKIDSAMVHHVEEYAHPQYSLSSISGQQKVGKLQGINRTYFAGAHLGFGFHEDGVVSAVKVAKLLGVEPTWKSQR
jgi:uncharacterized protein